MNKPVIQQHLTKINKGKKGDNEPEFIILHFVGARGQAWDNANFFRNVYRGSSAQYFVDPKDILQVVEDDTPAWTIGDGFRTRKGAINGYVHPSGATNTNSINIELCQDVTTGKDVWHWDFHPDTIEKAEWLVRKLQKEHNIDDNHVIRHFDATGKMCPGNWQWNNWEKWWDFKERLEKDIKQPTPSATPKDEGKIKHLEEIMHLVEPGETLSGIAKAHKTTVASLVKWNELDDKNLIFPETKLFVKAPPKTWGSNTVAKPKHKPTPAKPVVTTKPKTITQLAEEVIDGKWGSGDDRKKRLGAKYEAVQNKVNELAGAKVKPKAKPIKTISQLADEVNKGAHGSGRERMVSLGVNYTKVQAEVNKRLRNK